MIPPQQNVEGTVKVKADGPVEEDQGLEQEGEDVEANPTKRSKAKVLSELYEGASCLNANEGSSSGETAGKKVEVTSTAAQGDCMPTWGRAVLDDSDYEMFDFRPLRRRKSATRRSSSWRESTSWARSRSLRSSTSSRAARFVTSSSLSIRVSSIASSTQPGRIRFR